MSRLWIAVLVVFTVSLASPDANARWKRLGRMARSVESVLGRVVSVSEPRQPDASVPALAPKKRFASIPGFRLGGSYEREARGGTALRPGAEIRDGGVGGTTLESLGIRGGLRLAYMTAGSPRKNRDGKVTNAVIVSTHYSGDSADLYQKWHGSVIGPGKLIDTNRYYVVFLDAVGLWGAIKPSAGLGKRFPRYNAWDYAQANYRLLRDHLDVDEVQLALGPSMGAFQSYMLAALHPDYVKAIMPIGGSTTLREAADLRGLFRTMSTTMELSRKSSWVTRLTGGKHLRLFGREVKGVNRKVTAANEDTLARGLGVLMPTAFAGGYWHDKSWDAGRVMTYSPDRKSNTGSFLRERAKGNNPLDFLYRNAAGETYHVRPYLDRIKAKTLILHVDNDKWLNLAYAKEAASTIKDARLLTRGHDLAHYGVFDLPRKDHLGGEVAGWMREIGMTPGTPD